ncbi:hypothetical protein J2848_002670 [Azospirillum lipoferum]|uniref:DUF3604 domain-containing protein n=1 Tax=Azospirillum lipoferum TaxID=193 RepID=A0A5A9GNP2_AZOLI|nr:MULTISPECIES: DUF3604 domain-containing protein [Azospirillum]KAA0596061.1 DUF3604 domain-containing protein [Azospirillum lipoferum]MCP1610997.1 hypothetical protein [Azospirillum lipoferum]MDW5533870.1 DUF3604 domain-containing protein [Azospirillum sp. NL1]
MPNRNYLPEQMGTMTASSPGPFLAGSHQSIVLTYTAGDFGIDDTGSLRICWRTTSDMGKPQFKDPTAANYTTITASNGATLDCAVDRSGIRPWGHSLTIRVARGFLRKGETITVHFGDRSGGSPGLRLQTTIEYFEFKTLVDAFATNEYTELPVSPRVALVPGGAVRWRALLPSQNILGETFRLCIAAEDLWGNPTGEGRLSVLLSSSLPVAGLPEAPLSLLADGTLVVDGLTALDTGDLRIEVRATDGVTLCTSTPARVVANAMLRHYWGDLHGQSGETIGTNSARDYFLFARDKAFLDVVGHQGNDFQITDAFWADLNRLTSTFYEPGRFVTFPGYEWSGNTGLGGDRNVFYGREGQPIRRSSRILVGDDVADEDCHTAGALFEAIGKAGEDVVITAHVGGRYADLSVAHDGRLERAVEIHSTWGTFEWLLHDAFDLGHRPGIVCHSDDHKGRQGATMPGASTFGAIGGLTCYLAPELTREGIFAALRARRQYGTTGTRLYLNVVGTFDQPIEIFADDPLLGPTSSSRGQTVTMGAVATPRGIGGTLDVDVIGSAPIERIDVFHGKEIVETFRPYAAPDLGRRLRVLWSGAEYRGRGRETVWNGKARVTGNGIDRVEPINFLNPERPVGWSRDEGLVTWTSVTTGNMAGFDLWLDAPKHGRLAIETNLANLEVDLAELADDERSVDAGGLARRLRVWRMPETKRTMAMRIAHRLPATPLTHDLPVYVRVTQEDGHQAWSSPIYLVP